jgi:Crinkler effector protein N-terminal domain
MLAGWRSVAQRVAGGTLNPALHRCHEPRVHLLVIGETTQFPVKIDKTESVDELKKAIKKEKEHRLDAFAAYSLKLYQVQLDKSLNKHERTSELARLSQNLNNCTELDEEDQLSKIFGEGAPDGKKYYTIVQLPTGQSIDSRACGVILMAGGVDVT